MEPNIYAISIPDAKLMAKGAWDISIHITDLEIIKTITVSVSSLKDVEAVALWVICCSPWNGPVRGIRAGWLSRGFWKFECQFFCWFAQSIDWLIDWLMDWLIDWLIDILFRRLFGL